MSNKRLLVIQDDPLLGNIYRDRLEIAGFAVETARNSEAALRLCKEMHPDVVVVDPILPADDVVASISRIRAQAPGQQTPILLLPTAHRPLAASAQQAGATRLIERSANPLATVVSEVVNVLGMPPRSSDTDGEIAQFDSQWKQATRSAAPGSLTMLRQALHEVLRNPQGAPQWRELLQRTHTFAGQMSIFSDSVISHLSSALEILVHGLQCFPERINPLTLRTIGQAVDFLATLWEREAYSKPADLGQAHVFIVEDEPSARELIQMAMQLVGLSADGLETPGASLAVLSTNPCDLIFLDINLPEMNGFEVCTKVRALPLHERTPIVFLTGMTSFQNRVQSSLSGGNDFVGKPFNVAELGVKALIWLFKNRIGLLN